MRNLKNSFMLYLLLIALIIIFSSWLYLGIEGYRLKQERIFLLTIIISGILFIFSTILFTYPIINFARKLFEKPGPAKNMSDFIANRRVALASVFVFAYIYLLFHRTISLYRIILGSLIVLCGVMLRTGALYFKLDSIQAIEIRGPYSFTRHPRYWGSLLIFIGFSSMLESYLIWVLLTIFFIIPHGLAIKYEEKELKEIWGPLHENYQKSVKIAPIPWNILNLESFPQLKKVKSNPKKPLLNKDTLILWALVLIGLILVLIKLRLQ